MFKAVFHRELTTPPPPYKHLTQLNSAVLCVSTVTVGASQYLQGYSKKGEDSAEIEGRNKYRERQRGPGGKSAGVFFLPGLLMANTSDCLRRCKK